MKNISAAIEKENSDMEFTLQTLTPLWTGSTDPKKMDRVHETGINGSLRWWYEAIMRGMVGTGPHRERVCNPTAKDEDRCNFEKHHWVCRACDLFGATGWKRRFRLEINSMTPVRIPSEEVNIRIRPQGHGWYFFPACSTDSISRISGQMKVLRPRRTDNCDPIQGKLEVGKRRSSDVENDLRVIAEVINRWGGLGAKTQHGWGVANLRFGSHPEWDAEAFLAGLPNDNVHDQGLPTIGNMFFARLYLKDGIDDNWWKSANLGTGVKDKIQGLHGQGKDHAKIWRLPDNFSVPSAPAVKYKLRYGKNGASYLPVLTSSGNEKFFFGEISKPAVKAKLNISNAFKWEGKWQFRIWGWFPEEGGPNDVSRNQLMMELHEIITDPSSHQPFWDEVFGTGVVDLSKSVWREVDRSSHHRNTPGTDGARVAPPTSAELLRCLLV